jgi:hypothetical protein
MVYNLCVLFVGMAFNFGLDAYGTKQGKLTIRVLT